MGTILRWREPGLLRRLAQRDLSIWARIRGRCQGPFLIGAALGLFYVVIEFVKQTPRPLFRSIVFVVAIGALFAVVYGLASLLPVRILVRHDHIGRQHGESYTRLEYQNLRDFHIETVPVEGTMLDVLALEGEDGATFTFELSEEVDKKQLEETLILCIRNRRLTT